MTTRATPDIPERVSRLEGAYEQVTERLRDLLEAINGVRQDVRSEVGSARSDIRTGTGSLRAEIKSLRTTIIVIGGGYWASIVGGFIALLVTG